MTLFEDIQTRYDQQRAAVAQQSSFLRIAVRDMAFNLEKHLGLSSTRWYQQGLAKAQDKYIRLGYLERGEFQELDWTGLPTPRGYIPFTLSITVDSMDSSTRDDYYYSMTVMFCDDGYKFEIDSFSEAFILSVADVQSGDFSRIYSALVEHLKAVLDPSLVIIKN